MMKKMIFALLLGLGVAQVSTAVAATTAPKADVVVKAEKNHSTMTKFFVGAGFILSAYGIVLMAADGNKDLSFWGKAAVDAKDKTATTPQVDHKDAVPANKWAWLCDKHTNIASGLAKVFAPLTVVDGKKWNKLNLFGNVVWDAALLYAAIELGEYLTEYLDEPVYSKLKKAGKRYFAGSRKEVKAAVKEATAAK